MREGKEREIEIENIVGVLGRRVLVVRWQEDGKMEGRKDGRMEGREEVRRQRKTEGRGGVKHLPTIFALHAELLQTAWSWCSV
jgi:hypothetical protein